MTNSSTPEPSGRPGFVADLGFLLVVPWLLLWRYELTDASSRSLWLGWMPAVVVPLLCLAAVAVGISQRQPKGFLPIPARWSFLAAVLVLPAWIAIAIADMGNRMPGYREAAAEIRATVESGQTAASTPEERRQNEDALAAAESAEQLDDALAKAEARGASMPLAEPSATADEMDPETNKRLGQAMQLAAALEQGQPLPPEIAEETKAAGLDEEEIMKALLVLAAGLLAPLLGLSAQTTLLLLQMLVASGEFSLGNLMKVTHALVSSARPDGTFNEPKLLDSLARSEARARDVQTLLMAAEKAGGRSTKDSQLFQLLRRAADDAATPPGALRCYAQTLEQHKGKPRTDLEKLLQAQCSDLTPKQRRAFLDRDFGGSR